MIFHPKTPICAELDRAMYAYSASPDDPNEVRPHSSYN